jgi:1A family penicillin-binding protein
VKKTKKKRWLIKIFGLFFIIALGVGFWVLNIVTKISKELPNPEQLVSRQISQSTKIYDRTGEILLYEIHGEEKRTIIASEEIPDFVKKATLAIEDQSFYQHAAFDWRATLRAILTDIVKGKAVQGGSTITQQLARNAFLTPEKTIQRKIKELVLANWIEKKYTKDQILTLYLNQIPFGSNAYGIEVASQIYFNKSAKDLSLAEAATLAAMIQAPTYYSPWGNHQAELISRKNYVLEQMFKLGFIDEEEKNRGQNTELTFASPSIGSIKAPHFVMMIKDYLVDKYGEEVVENGGLKVITSLNWNFQQIAEKVVKAGAERNTELYQGKNAALVAQDAKTGQVLALVGSKDYFDIENEGNFNVASQGLRQPGSALKPFVYITAFIKGYTPETMVFDLPTEFSSYTNDCPVVNINFSDNNPLCFHPKNFDGVFRGPVNFRTALGQSINVPSVKVLYLAGLIDTLNMAQNFGITTLTDPSRYGLSLVLGGGEVKLIDMVAAYSVFSQEGIKHKQNFILEIQNSSGDTLEKYFDSVSQVVEPQYTRLINDVLSDTETRAGLFRNSLNLTVFPDRQVALKTGTTNDYKDAWAIGYTPSLVVGVWAGNNDNTPMQKQAGSILAAVPIWHDFMSQILNSQPIEVFTKPEPYYLINTEVHNILYYVDKNDPLGPVPTNPLSDSQFLNWESPVQVWKQQNQAQLINQLINQLLKHF